MIDNNKAILFEQTPIPKAVMQLAISMILSSLVMMIYNLADTYSVGIINNSIQNATVTLTAPVLLAFNAVNNLFEMGSSSMMSRALGGEDYKAVRRSSAFGLYCVLFSDILFSLLYTVFPHPLPVFLRTGANTMEATLGYLKWTILFGAAPAILSVIMACMVHSRESALRASIGTISGCFLNVILGPIFILPWGLDMGAAGAGLATFLFNCVAYIYFLVLLYARRKNTFVCILPKKFSMQKAVVLDVCGMDIPAAIQNLLNVTGMTILSNFTSSYGAQTVAAMDVSQKINMVPMQMAMRFSQRIIPLISYSYANGNHERMKEAIVFAVRTLLPFLIVVSLGYYFGADALIRSFMNDESIIAYDTWFLRGFCLRLFFLCMDLLAVGVFQAAGMGRAALSFAILRKIVLEIPVLYVLNRPFPLYGLAYVQFTVEFVLAIATVFVLCRIPRKMQKDDRTTSEGAPGQTWRNLLWSEKRKGRPYPAVNKRRIVG